jgi:pilus assembly protein FimV
LLLWSFFEFSLEAPAFMKRTTLPTERAVGTPIRKSLPKLRLSTLAFAAAVCFGLASPDALALALGRVTVQSALGEPLRADIDVPEITPEEISSLRANIASPEQFRSAGLEYNPALGNAQITLQRRPDGTYFLHLASDRTISDPFVDVILETRWASGRVQRDFTLLFDPPTARARQQPSAPIAAQVSPSPAGRRPPAPSVAVRPAPAPGIARAPGRPAAPARATGPAAGENGQHVTVQSGDTAGRIAATHKPASVSLDQMLVALLRANPDAFIGGNVNRLRSGAVLQMPSGDEAGALSPGEAHQTLVAQSRDFNEFRRRLAQGVPTAAAPAAGRQAAGRVEAQVEDKKAAAATPDKLTLSRGGVQAKGSSADQIARQRAAQDQATRVAELNKNLADLNKLAGATPGAAGTGARPGPGVTAPPGVSASAAKPAAVPAPVTAPVTAAKPASAPAATTVAAAAKPATPAPAAAPTAAPASAAAATAASAKPAPAAAPNAAAVAQQAPGAGAPGSTAPAAAASSAPAAAASATPATAAASAARPAGSTAVAAAAKPPVARKPAPPPPPEPSLLDDMLENPLIPALGVGLLAVLAGFGVYKMRQKRKTAAVDSSFLESRLQPDSFFGASGGQRIDTAEANNPTGSSMVYSPSQLDAAGDVDPVAEADVYLAYGRDLQAEEILKEALRTNPQRVAIHSKLLEIYAKRRDVKAFEVVAAEAFNLTGGTGADWEHICDLGRDLDASNPLYRPGGQPGAGVAAAAVAAGVASGASQFTSTQAVQAQAQPPAASDVDLDLDFSLGDEPDTLSPQQVAAQAMPPAGRPHEPVPTAPAAIEPLPLDMSFSTPAPVQAAPAAAPESNALEFTSEPLPVAPPAATPAPAASKPADEGMLEFDLGGLSLDLPGSEATPPAATKPAAAPVAAKAPAKAPAEDPDATLAPLSFDLDTPPPAVAAAAAAAGAPAGGGADSPLATKLALAEEFNAIGDADGARSLAEEVLAEASGDLKSRAQKLLAEIG